MKKLSQIASKEHRLIVGLISGTSADGVDAALVRVGGVGDDTRLKAIAWDTVPYAPELRSEVLSVAAGEPCGAGRIASLNFLLGRAFADAAMQVCSKAGVELGRVDLIGSHGQTVFHRGPERSEGRASDWCARREPRPGLEPLKAEGGGTDSGGEPLDGAGCGPDLMRHAAAIAPPCTLQLGEPCIIAERTGVTTVADFRPRDMAAGGQGAPLVPLADYILFASPEASRCMLNLGGIANVTFLPGGCACDEVIAFDTGPGNMILDALAAIFSGGDVTRDEGGSLALEGRTDRRLLEKLLTNPFFNLSPPKSTGREVFGEGCARAIVEQGARLGLSEADIMMTAVSLTAKTIGAACRRFFPGDRPRPRIPGARLIDEVIAGGGGVHNVALMKALRRELKPAKVRTSDELGVPADSKEAVAFAVLANETVCGRQGNVPSATGASKSVILGKIVP